MTELKRYFITKRFYSNDLKVTEHPNGDWVKASDVNKIKADAVREAALYLESHQSTSSTDSELLNDFAKSLESEHES